MRLRYVVSLAAAAAAAATLAASASAGDATFQLQVMESSSTCHLTIGRVGSSERMILFHIINNSSIPRGIIVWGVRSTMALPGQSANLFVNFRGPGNYPFACTANSYRQPTITGRGTFSIGLVSGHVTIRLTPARGGAAGSIKA